jgi:peptidoglycan/LPS O-acetylase OafA/YrhL
MSNTGTHEKVHLKGLNGLRAIAALGVLVGHAIAGTKDFNLNPCLLGADKFNSPKIYFFADFSVTIFFALSGFLITYLLLLEKKSGSINISHFYIRRILRIWPLYYLYILLCFAFNFLFGWHLNFGGVYLPMILFFAANVPHILYRDITLLAHYWSLAVEEQFYIMWPWLIKLNKKKLPLIITGIILLLMALKLFIRFVIPGTDSSIAYRFTYYVRFSCMLIGALGATLFHAKHNLFLTIFSSKISQIIAWLIMAIAALNLFHISSVLDHEIIAVVACVLIIGQCTVKNRLINLETGIMDFLGKISFGIYVYHPLIIFLLSKILCNIAIVPVFKYPIVFLSIFLVTILVAYISYTFFEKKFLKMKLNYSTVISSGSRNE